MAVASTQNRCTRGAARQRRRIACPVVIAGLLLTLAGVPAAQRSARAATRRDIRERATQTHTFHSESWLHPPVVWVSGKDPDPLASGDIFLDAQATRLQAGPMILDPQGRLIWFDPLPKRGVARDVEVQQYGGQSVLTFWQGYGNGFGVGQDTILDHHYQTLAIVRAGNGYAAGTHAFAITPAGTALISAYRVVHANLSSVGGPRKGQLIDSTIQEIDIRTGRVLWQWRARDHVRLTASYAGKPGRGPYDFFHLNSIQQLPNGNLLVSARNTWTVYEISKQTGRIVWELGGKHSGFKMGRGTSFEWQHDAQMQADGTITVFDNGAALTKNESHSRALRIRLHPKTRRATLARAYVNRPAVLSPSQGSVQVLPDGNTFVGWGAAPYFSEFGRDGRQRFTAHLAAPMQSYRAFRFQWWGQPTAPPDISLAATRQGTTVYAAWNGATDVASWRVLAGSSPDQLAFAGSFAKGSFETKMWVGDTEPFFAVQAVDSAGQLLGTSTTVQRPAGP